MDRADVERWFGDYLTTFVDVCRGARDDAAALLDHYSVPMLVSSDAGASWLTDEAQVVGLVQRQAEAMAAAGYVRTEVLEATTTLVNRTCAEHRGRFARLRGDGTEISRFSAVYLIVDGPAGRRIAVLALH